MRFVRQGVSIRQNGWRCGPIYSDDGKNWYTSKGEAISDNDIRNEGLAEGMLLPLIVIFILFVVLIFR